ncbi:hypothetical protein R3P38DRAFT_2890462 [Favolaschia claudopus]|uniref:Protein kinase domain-containing protein n=1 Tax=Favolaschia claudopus TaxID=2862362 RepID=A0AAW0CUL6_9AGAR
MFADPAVLGYDPSIVKGKLGRYIKVAGDRYDIEETLFISDVIRGRGTVCWRVRRGEKVLVIKDTWADDSRDVTEAEILQQAAGVVGVPRVVAAEDVEVNGVSDTENLRSNLPGFADLLQLIEKRTHVRLVLDPYGHPLVTFKTRKELISALLDVVKVHEDLWKARILHRDISVNNILLVNPDDIPPPRPSKPVAGVASPESDLPPTPRDEAALVSSSDSSGPPPPYDEAAPVHSSTSSGAPLRKGLLIDVDYALVFGPNGERGAVARGHRTGTLPFMAMEVLMLGKDLPKHEPRHDLESLFYVLFWICIHYAGPGGVERQNFDIHESILRTWVNGDSYDAIGQSKGFALTGNPRFWTGRVLPCLAPYFEPLKPCLTEWRQLIANDTLDYETLSKMLEGTLSSLDDNEDWSRKDDPEGYGPERKSSNKMKRKLVPIVEGAEDDDEDDDDEKDKDYRPPKTSRRPNGKSAARSAPPELSTGRVTRGSAN